MGCAKASCLPSLCCPGCFSSQSHWGPEVLRGVFSLSQEIAPEGHVLGGAGLTKAWGSEVKGHILQIPGGGWRQLKVPPLPNISSGGVLGHWDW